MGNYNGFLGFGVMCVWGMKDISDENGKGMVNDK